MATICPGCGKRAALFRLKKDYKAASAVPTGAPQSPEQVPTSLFFDDEKGQWMRRHVPSERVPTDGLHRYDPFCTLRCALRYARVMFKRHGTSFTFKT